MLVFNFLKSNLATPISKMPGAGARLTLPHPNLAVTLTGSWVKLLHRVQNVETKDKSLAAS
jgi:hypothetical protein